MGRIVAYLRLSVNESYQDFLFDSRGALHYYLDTPMKRNDDHNSDDGWDYGDIWDQEWPDDPEPGHDIEYVEVLRGDTGKGYSDTTMMEYILYLGAAGIQATFDAYPLREIKIYVLKVEAGREEEAMKLLREKLKS
jgi:hypothetical protein